MGTEMLYKVTGTVLKDSEGRKCNQIVKAFKPLGAMSKGAQAKNQHLMKQHRIYDANAYVKNGAKWTGRFIKEDGGPSIEYDKGGTIWDYEFDQQVQRQSVVGKLIMGKWV